MTPAQWQDLIKSALLVGMGAVVTFYASRLNLFAQISKTQEFERQKMADQRAHERIASRERCLADIVAHAFMIQVVLDSCLEFTKVAQESQMSGMALDNILAVQKRINDLCLDLMKSAESFNDKDIWNEAANVARKATSFTQPVTENLTATLRLMELCRQRRELLASTTVSQ